MFSTSFVEPIAMFRKFLNSLLVPLPQPSAILFDIERDALLSWEDIAYISSFGKFGNVDIISLWNSTASFQTCIF